LAERLEGHRVATAESCTAGRVSAALAGVGGASAWFRGAVVAYEIDVKRALLDVTATSVYTERAAAEMASGVARLLDADVAVATTGVLGDEPEEGVPPGTLFLATFVAGDVQTLTCRVRGSTPDERSTSAVAAALDMLLERLASETAA